MIWESRFWISENLGFSFYKPWEQPHEICAVAELLKFVLGVLITTLSPADWSTVWEKNVALIYGSKLEWNSIQGNWLILWDGYMIVCMYVFVCVCMCVYLSVCLVCLYVSVYICMWSVYLCACVCVCISKSKANVRCLLNCSSFPLIRKHIYCQPRWYTLNSGMWETDAGQSLWVQSKSGLLNRKTPYSRSHIKKKN